MTTTRAQLTTAEQLHLRQSAERLKRRFEGQLNTETIERFLYDSADRLLGGANATTWVPLLAERFAADRIRAMIRLESDVTSLNPSVLFLCVHNAGRSQMAAGLMRKLAGAQVDVFSGGSEPADKVNQAAVTVMSEMGIDISREIPQPWADEIVRARRCGGHHGMWRRLPYFPGEEIRRLGTGRSVRQVSGRGATDPGRVGAKGPCVDGRTRGDAGRALSCQTS